MWINRADYFKLIARDAINAERDSQVLDLKRQITELKEQLRLAQERTDREQQRADNALDCLALTRGGEHVSPPVRPSVPEDDPFAEDAAIVEDIQYQIKQRGPLEVLMSH